MTTADKGKESRQTQLATFEHRLLLALLGMALFTAMTLVAIRTIK